MFNFFKKKGLEAELERGMEIIIRLTDDSDPTEYQSKIVGYEEDRIIISMPMYGDRALGVYNTLPVSVSAMVKGERLGFVTKVVGVVKADPKNTRVKLVIPTEIQRGCKRKYYRMPVHMDVLYGLGRKKDSLVPSTKVTLLEIAGGGCSFGVDAEVAEGDRVCIDFSRTPIDIGLVEAQVVRLKLRGKIKRTLFVKFSDINEIDRTKIVLFINEKLIEERKDKEGG